MKLHSPGLSNEEIAFIQNHLSENVGQLILKSGKYKNLDVRKLAAQIQSRQKAAKKLPEWYAHEKLIFPPALCVEQSSSEAAAKFKASLVSGKKLIDITGGMGVDSFYLSKEFEQVDYFEMQEEVAAAAAYNFEQLGVRNIRVHAENSLNALETSNFTSTWIYTDPARRDENREKVVRLADCAPDIPNNLETLFKTAPNILLKTSPLLDITLGVNELRNVKEVYVIGYEQECKELLFVLNKDFEGEHYQIKVRILDHDGTAKQTFDFNPEDEKNAQSTFSDPLGYLYEPHAAVLKSGGFKMIGKNYQVNKLAVNSQLYTSEHLAENFPGRSMQILAVCKPDIKEISKHIPGDKANITVRNFPAKPEELRKKWKLKEGGEHYLFATTLSDNSKVVIVTTRAAI
ncbi:THUMP-like domain-containing protein [Dyadobacter luticola]|uniref:Uncharacterized protein n=1 Tax=Dyadobacter luticola TaxID=1979387 RepID=A0A5R9KYG8_9BACT|nr:class I SAM-dependent methyltransferase [Dyadobacter luticola]TLV01130.1 hypothetical protein FEN17_16900 [Dyadobacter luticola]